jgi:hypothetical protein
MNYVHDEWFQYLLDKFLSICTYRQARRATDAQVFFSNGTKGKAKPQFMSNI